MGGGVLGSHWISLRRETQLLQLRAADGSAGLLFESKALTALDLYFALPYKHAYWC